MTHKKEFLPSSVHLWQVKTCKHLGTWVLVDGRSTVDIKSRMSQAKKKIVFTTNKRLTSRNIGLGKFHKMFLSGAWFSPLNHEVLEREKVWLCPVEGYKRLRNDKAFQGYLRKRDC